MLTIATTSGEATTIDAEQLGELAAQLRGPILAPGDVAYDDARVVYNGMFDRRPGAIIRCRATADVIDAVNFARRHDLQVAVRGGGHSVAGNSVCDDGLVIDLTELNGVHVDRERRTIRAQGGATWGDLDREGQAFGLAVPGGVVSTTGIAGLTLGGGIGWLRNRHGLTCDNLLSAEVVTADGELVTASATEHPDLFWALRGGGGNFGIVTSFEYQAHPVGPIVSAAIPFYPLEDAPSLLRQWRDWLATAPDEVTATALLWTVPVDDHMPPPAQGQDVLILATVHCGDVDEGAQAIQAVRELGTPIVDLSGPLPFRAVQTAFDWVFPKGQLSSYWKSLYLSELSDATIDVVMEAAMNRSSPLSYVEIPQMGNGVRRIGAEESAVPERDAPYMVSLSANWSEPGDNDAHRNWSRSYWDRLQPHSTGTVYHNFLGQEDTDAEAVMRATYGRNYDRLVDVKTRYDPTNMFRLNQNIRPRGA